MITEFLCIVNHQIYILLWIKSRFFHQIVNLWILNLKNAVNEKMGKRAIYKAIFESAALVGASGLQVYLLRRLFHRRLEMSGF